MAYHGSRRRAALPIITVYCSNVSLSLHWKFACDCFGSFFPGVLSTQENNNNSYRPVSDWRHLDFCDSVHGAVIQNDHFSRIQAGLPCLYLQFWNHWLRYHLFIILLPCGSITAYHCYHPNLRCDWIQTETHHSTRQPTPVKSTSTGTDVIMILAMLVTVVAVLIVCRFPLIFGTMACFSGLKTACSWNFLFLGWFLACFNSGINPWIYFIFNEQFF